MKGGEISKLDLEIANALLKLEKTYPVLQNVSFQKSVEVGGVLAILVNRGDVSRILGYGGKILREIGEKIGRKKIKILAHDEEPRRFLEDLFSPASVVTINTLWLPDGSTETKVVIPRRDSKKLPMKIDLLQDLARQIRNITLRVEFEDMR